MANKDFTQGSKQCGFLRGSWGGDRRGLRKWGRGEDVETTEIPEGMGRRLRGLNRRGSARTVFIGELVV